MIARILEGDHEAVGKLLEKFLMSLKEGSPDVKTLEKARDALQNHIYWEETILFREAETEQNSARIHGLEVEHGGIWKLLDRIGEIVREGNIDLAIDRTEGLLRVLETHNSAEEGTVYSQLDLMDEKAQARLIQFEVQHARAPAGWKCRILSRR